MFICLSTIRNGGKFLEYWLKKMSLFVDAMVINNDCSIDNTLNILNKLKDECNIEIINSDIPIQHNYKNEFNNLEQTKYSNDYIVYTKLLETGRKIGGKTFFRPSLDELPSSTFFNNDKSQLKSIAESLSPGQGMSLKWNDVLDNKCNIRDDYYGRSMHQQFLFKDSENVSYKNVIDFTGDKREYGVLSIPILPKDCKTISNYKHSILHFQYISFSDTLLKQYHYKLQDGVLGREGTRLCNPDILNNTFNEFMLPLLDRQTIKLDNDCFSLYEDLDYSIFIGWQDYRLDLIKKIIEDNGFEKVSKISTWIPKHNPIKWGRDNWSNFYIKNWSDFENYKQIVYDLRNQDLERIK